MNKTEPNYPINPTFVAWLDAQKGRGNHFKKVDPTLFPPVICKMKKGILPITFEAAIRIERAQRPSENPLRAVDLMTWEQDRELYRYVTGQAPAPVFPPRAVR